MHIFTFQRPLKTFLIRFPFGSACNEEPSASIYVPRPPEYFPRSVDFASVDALAMHHNPFPAHQCDMFTPLLVTLEVVSVLFSPAPLSFAASPCYLHGESVVAALSHNPITGALNHGHRRFILKPCHSSLYSSIPFYSVRHLNTILRIRS